jgi:catechol 2,3-dioxygenase-like lactoylglutathione lyase family enzyme
MNLTIQHIEIHVSSLEKAKEFYVNKLGLEIIDEIPPLNLIALKAGNIRISIFAGYEPPANSKRTTGTHIIFRTDNLEDTIETLKGRGVVFLDGIFEAPGFIRGIATADPDGNIIEIGQYLRDPLKKA